MRRPGTLLAAAVVAAALSVAAAAVPAAAVGADAEQIVITLVDEPAPWDFDDPCTGDAVHGIGLESGVVRITELGDQGHHERVNVRGVAELSDSDDNFVGTWTRVRRRPHGDRSGARARGVRQGRHQEAGVLQGHVWRKITPNVIAPSMRT
jgi:hypothetical protein